MNFVEAGVTVNLSIDVRRYKRNVLYRQVIIGTSIVVSIFLLSLIPTFIFFRVKNQQMLPSPTSETSATSHKITTVTILPETTGIDYSQTTGKQFCLLHSTEVKRF